jgi:hypothetical protein
MQSRIGSIIESVANIAVGFGVALASQMLIFPLYGVHLSLYDNAMITVWFTIISLARSYALRRIFNAITVRRFRARSD